MCDPYSQWKIREREAERWLKSRPLCSHCCKHIQEERLFDINGELYHVECAEEEFKKWTEDYTE